MDGWVLNIYLLLIVRSLFREVVFSSQDCGLCCLNIICGCVFEFHVFKSPFLFYY